MHSTPQTASASCASTPTTLQIAYTTRASTPRTPQIVPANTPIPSTPQITPVTNHQQSQSAQQNKQDLKILQININGTHKRLTELTHIMKTNNIEIVTVQETKLANHHITLKIPQYSTHKTDWTHKKGGGLLTFVKHNINFTPLNTPNNINRNKTGATNHQNSPHMNKASTYNQHLHTTQRHHRPEPWHRRHRHNN